MEKKKEKEYELHSKVETERAIIRIYMPKHETEEEKEAFRRECVKVNREIAMELYKEGKLKPRVANI